MKKTKSLEKRILTTALLPVEVYNDFKGYIMQATQFKDYLDDELYIEIAHPESCHLEYYFCTVNDIICVIKIQGFNATPSLEINDKYFEDFLEYLEYEFSYDVDDMLEKYFEGSS